MNKNIVKYMRHTFDCFHLIRNEKNFKNFLIPSHALNKCIASNFNCSSCNYKISENGSKSTLLPANYFEFFDMPVDYNIDKKTLTKNFRQLMRKFHPDLFTQKSEIEKQYSADQSSLANKAYKVLNNPIDRGLYMLELVNENFEKEAIESHETDSEKKLILMEILELNEIIDEIKTANEVEELEKKLDDIMEPLENELENAFKTKDYKLAISILSKMKYYKNVHERLQDLKLKFNLSNI